MHIQSELLHLFEMTMGMFPTWLVESILRNPGAFSDILMSSQKAHSLGSFTMGLNRYSLPSLSLLLLLLCSSLCGLLLCCLSICLSLFFKRCSCVAVDLKIFYRLCFSDMKRNRLNFHLLKEKGEKRKRTQNILTFLYFFKISSTQHSHF